MIEAAVALLTAPFPLFLIGLAIGAVAVAVREERS